MTDQEITNSLRSLGLGRHNYRAVALMPLFEVAWADGRVQAAERDLIRLVAGRYGLESDDPWVEHWVRQKPSPGTSLAARQVLLALISRDGRGWEVPETLEALVSMCLGVAEAAGGLFGIAFTVERSERDAIEDIAESLSLGPALPPEVVRAWQTVRRPRPRPATPDPLSQVETQLRSNRKRTIEELEREARANDPTAGRSVEAAVAAMAWGSVPGVPSLVDDETERVDGSPSGGERRRSGPTVIPGMGASADDDDDEDPTVPFFERGSLSGGAYVLDDDTDR